MVLNLKFSIWLFPALLCATYISFSVSKHCYKKFPELDLTKLDAKSIVKDVLGFYKHFNKRYHELEMFIKKNISRSHEVEVNFFLFTQKNMKKPDHLKRDTLKKSHFNPYLPVKVLVHGLQPVGEKDHGTEAMRHALLVRGNYNVIVMRYEKVSAMPYTEALKYLYLVAKNAADFLHDLVETFNTKPHRLHLIGFEFGGQVVGNIGKHLKRIGRITALDPSGALFENFRPEHRINKGDASFVDIIHTSTRPYPRGLGLRRTAGHQDFYPNGGEHQPGCKPKYTAKDSGGESEAEFKNAICSNERALELFVESICTRDCKFLGVKCDNYRDYENDVCRVLLDHTEVMGFDAHQDFTLPENSRLYVKTKSKYPYCAYTSWS